MTATQPMHDKKKRVNPYKHTSHEGFDHDSLESFGYDWERIGNPYLEAKFPLKLYLPQTTEDVVKIIFEVRALGQELKILNNVSEWNVSIVLTFFPFLTWLLWRQTGFHTRVHVQTQA